MNWYYTINTAWKPINRQVKFTANTQKCLKIRRLNCFVTKYFCIWTSVRSIAHSLGLHNLQYHQLHLSVNTTQKKHVLIGCQTWHALPPNIWSLTSVKAKVPSLYVFDQRILLLFHFSQLSGIFLTQKQHTCLQKLF